MTNTMITIIKNNKGVTLIEIIVVLVLVSILTAGAGMGIVAITQGYLYAGKNAAMAQKTNIAMKRMSRELQGILSVSAISSNSITFTSLLGTRTLGFDNNAVKLSDSPTPLSNGDILMDTISSLTFTYNNSSGNPWLISHNIRTLTGITISFQVIRSDITSGSMTFSTTVYLRNNRNTGGTI